jgi:small-conductance mechanosensitive channel
MGLTLKDPLTEIVQGTNLLLSDKFRVGDVICLSSTNACGRIVSFEWTDVIMEGDDNSVTRIPHSTLAKTQLVNMTRMQHSSVSQTLLLPNLGANKIISLLQDIGTEIRESCPKVNAQQPFRVSLTDLSGDNVEISIESHFHIPRLSDEYWENRQTVLMAVNRAIIKYNKSE